MRGQCVMGFAKQNRILNASTTTCEEFFFGAWREMGGGGGRRGREGMSISRLND